MTKYFYTVGHGKKQGFFVNFVSSPYLPYYIDLAASHACGWTGHRFEGLYNKVSNWAYKKETTLATVSIDRDIADRLAYAPDTWSWVDDPDEEDAESPETVDEGAEGSDRAGNQNAGDVTAQTA